MLAVSSFDSCVELLKRTRSFLGKKLSAFEFMDAQAMSIHQKAFKSQMPFEQMEQPYYLLVELLGDETEVYTYVEEVGDLIEDGVVPRDEKQFDSLWFLRKGVASAAQELGHVFKTNTAVTSIDDYYGVV